MEQQVRLNAIIEIPENYVLIEKVEFEEIKQQAEPEWVSGLKWLATQSGITSPQQLKEKILYPFRDELEDFVSYPNNTGEVWRFNSYYMKKWLRENFTKVMYRK